MKQYKKLRPFPWLPLAAGVIGCCLRSWLLSAAEAADFIKASLAANNGSIILEK